jgi:hypothetical protein
VLPTPRAVGGEATVAPAATTVQPNGSDAVSASPNVATQVLAPRSSALEWTHLSSENGDLPAPSNSTQQTASLILDVDKDGVQDFVIGIRRAPGPSMVWYRRGAGGWTKHLIDDATLAIEAGGAFYDIDGDGDLDVVMGGDADSNRLWWWENPYPNYSPGTPWTRREIKNSGSAKHHDQVFGDFDGDGQVELVFWNQLAKKLFIADIPSDPKHTQPWPYTEIYSWSSGDEHEGLAKADIDGDGKIDIVGGGRWFEHNGGTSYTPHVIDGDQTFARASAGQLKSGGRAEVVFGPGDGVGRLKWYEWTGSGWVGHDLLGFDVDHGHSLSLADIDGDGNLDIFCAEMRLHGDNPDAKMWVFLGDGNGNFTTTEVATGFGNHESKVGDLDGDGDLDILDKPYDWDTPRVDIWLSEHTGLSLDRWERHVIDADKPWRAIFITAADVDRDGGRDIITGGWWYQNPGSSGGTWTRRTIGSPLNNMAAVVDFDGDGDADVLGTQGKGSESNPNFVWARNDGSGSFTILDNVESGDGDFLQGVAVERFQSGGALQVALSWHAAGKGVQRLTVPSNPSSGTWTREQMSSTSQDEGLSAGDIDRDGDLDLLLGTKWLRNAGASWTAYTLNPTSGDPDRNHLADINRDGRLDAVVGFEAISEPGKLAWYEQGSSPTSTWDEHVIPDRDVIGPMSLDVADMDGDGDPDVVVGEHNMVAPSSAKLYVFENEDGQGTLWTGHVVYTGDEHHDGAQVVDIDGDGDLDIISIGWTHGRVLLYENKAHSGVHLEPRVWLPVILRSAATSPPGGARVTDGLQVLYTFEEGSGTTVYDISDVGTPLNLSVSGPAPSWISGGGLAINSSAIVASAGPATKVIEASRATNEITIEAWVKPANTTQDGPARIVTLSADPSNRNFTLGQDGDAYDVRLRTTTTDHNGRPSVTAPDGSLATGLTHVVYTRDTSGVAKIYVDGVERASGTVGGDLSNWDGAYRMALVNELTEDRPWLGELYLVAIFDRALTQVEVSQNFGAGR